MGAAENTVRAAHANSLFFSEDTGRYGYTDGLDSADGFLNDPDTDDSGSPYRGADNMYLILSKLSELGVGTENPEEAHKAMTHYCMKGLGL